MAVSILAIQPVFEWVNCENDGGYPLTTGRMEEIRLELEARWGVV